MIKDLLKEQQPSVYQALYRARKSGKVPHACLFFGPAGSMKKEAAILLAQSMFCEKQDVLACETCSACRRVLNGNYADFACLDGSQASIKKEEVDAVQERFAKTALEKSGWHVCILDHAENATSAAMSSMLKFIEEPSAQTLIILITDNISRILPTVVSRCVRIPFLPVSRSAEIQKGLDAGLDQEDAYFLSALSQRPESLKKTAESSEYRNAKAMLKQYLNVKGKREELLIDYEVQYRSKDKEQNLTQLKMFFELLIQYGRDVILSEDSGPAWYHEAVSNASLSKESSTDIIRIAQEARDRCNPNNDLNLVLDQAIYRLEESGNE